ncbi:MAG: pyridoxamine 5'-phosphate oxidase family protein [Acidimicrobiales bacterium]
MASNRRETIRMTDAEQSEFIADQKNLQVATLNADGTAHLSTLWFAVVEGRLVFETYTKSQKIKNLERDARIACLLEDGTEYNRLRGLQINGTAQLHTDPTDVQALAREVLRRNNPDVPTELLDEATRRMAAKRTAVVVVAERTVSWDHRKLDGAH